MLNRQHSLPVDHRSIVGYSISRGEARIALDVGADSVYFNNPDLPETRSEMALPLRVTGHIIGSLDVQSTQTNAFSAEDINVLTTLADQVAIAIENARLFSEAQRRIKRIKSIVRTIYSTGMEFLCTAGEANRICFRWKTSYCLWTRVSNVTQLKAVVQTGSLSLEKESDIDWSSYQTTRTNDRRIGCALEKRNPPVEAG